MDYPYDHNFLYDLWRQFRFDLSDYAELKSHIDPIILASWERCKKIFNASGVRSMSSTQRENLQSRLQTNANLISVALPYMEDIHQFIDEMAIAVVLTDHEGVVISLEIDNTHLSNLRKIGMNIGEKWTEDVTGTNAIGLSLITAMPTQVVGAEHFLQIFHDYTESAAPIHDEYGSIIGTIAILTLSQDSSPEQLPLVMTTARAISNQLQSNMMLEQVNRQLRQIDSVLQSVTDGVITWDTDGIVENINSMACQILRMRHAMIVGKRLLDVLNLPPYVATVIEAHQEISDVETRVQIDDRIVKCLISVRPIRNTVQETAGGIAMIRPLSQVRSLVNQQASPASSVTFDDFFYESAAMRDVIKQAKLAAKGSAGVLLVGEGGVGKTILAQAIHNASPRSPKPFVVVNCGMIPTELMVEELLGKETQDSHQGRPSKFELADGGTLLFDMIDQLSLQAQQIVLNVMNSRHIHRLHARHATGVNVRIIATTSQNMDDVIAAGSFLPQLYYLFNAFRLTIPPLRERKSDAIVLAQQFLDRAGRINQVEYEIEVDVLELLRRYPWPGNVRELESVIERAVIHATDETISVSDLPENIQKEHSFHPHASVPQSAISLVEAEYDAIIRAGWACKGVISDMADVLGINRSTLWRKLKQHGISADDFKT